MCAFKVRIENKNCDKIYTFYTTMNNILLVEVFCLKEIPCIINKFIHYESIGLF